MAVEVSVAVFVSVAVEVIVAVFVSVVVHVFFRSVFITQNRAWTLTVVSVVVTSTGGGQTGYPQSAVTVSICVVVNDVV